MLPPSFIESLAGTGLDAAGRDALCRTLEAGETSVSVRFNPYKLAERPEGEGVPWNRYGFYLAERPRFTLDPLFHAGVYYVQEASSMFLEHIYRSLFGEGERLRILDLCAAPGGKSTLLATAAGLESVVVANEVIRARALTLADNIRKWGLGNVAVTSNDPSHFGALEHWFDLIAVDAPCSGEGMFRKNPEATAQWSPQAVELCAGRQRRILSEVWSALRPGGILIYSTCTFNRRENEENVAWLVENYDCEGVRIETDPAWGIVRGEVPAGEGVPVPVFRFFPHAVRGEGFFCAVIRKAEGRVRTRLSKPRRTVFTEATRQEQASLRPWFGQPEFMHFVRIGDQMYGYYEEAYPAVREVAERLSVLYSGVHAGQLYHGKLKPEHPLALFHDLAREAVPQAELGETAALGYLRRGDIPADGLAEGMNLVCFEGVPLGWIKRIGNRTNNLYPKELRIQNL